MAEKRFALIIASCQYQDECLQQLIAPPQDAEALAQVLSDPAIGDFEVQTILNEPSYKANQSIETFFADRKRDELLLLYFSGHGIKDEDGRLYFATPDTRRKRLRTTAIPATLVYDIMRYSRSRRQILLLDCCYSGAFAEGMMAKADRAIGTKERFGGGGRVVLTASDALQYAFEGDEIAGDGVVRSVFTQTLVHGLKTGEADLNGDGLISLSELYKYVYDHVTEKTPQQRPEMCAHSLQGEIVIAHNPAPPSFEVSLVRVKQALTNSDFSARFVALGQLCKMLEGHDQVLANLAHAELERLSHEDFDPTIRRVAAGAIEISPTELTEKIIDKVSVPLDSKQSVVRQLDIRHALINRELMNLRTFWSSLDFLPGNSQRARGFVAMSLPSGYCGVTLDITFPDGYPEMPPDISLSATGYRSDEIKKVETSLKRKISSSWSQYKKTSVILKNLPENLVTCLIGRDGVTGVDFKEEIRGNLPIYYCKKCMNTPSKRVCYFHKTTLDKIIQGGGRCIIYMDLTINESDIGELRPLPG